MLVSRLRGKRSRDMKRDGSTRRSVLPFMHVVIENAFSTAECAAIRVLAPERMDEATLWNGTGYG